MISIPQGHFLNENVNSMIMMCKNTYQELDLIK